MPEKKTKPKAKNERFQILPDRSQLTLHPDLLPSALPESAAVLSLTARHPPAHSWRMWTLYNAIQSPNRSQLAGPADARERLMSQLSNLNYRHLGAFFEEVNALPPQRTQVHVLGVSLTMALRISRLAGDAPREVEIAIWPSA